MDDALHDRAWWRQVLRRVRRATGNAREAEDYLHTAFLRLEEYRSRTTVRNPAGFLVTAAVNIAADESRRRHVRNEAAGAFADIMNICDGEPLQTEALVARERLIKVREGLDQLTPRTREIFLMHRLDGMKYREIADHFAISVSAVEKHVAKAALFLANWTRDG
jgi:RNA polymerase sigma-70 factor (ECF subfamily)